MQAKWMEAEEFSDSPIYIFMLPAKGENRFCITED
jgi:hypothetical protein